MWLGFCAVLVAASPKDQSHDVIGAVPWLERSVNWTVSGAGPPVGEAEKSAVGGAGGSDTVMYPGPVAVSLPWEVVTVSATVYVPAAPYVWAGFWDVLVAPSPNDQDQVVMGALLSVERSEN